MKSNSIFLILILFLMSCKFLDCARRRMGPSFQHYPARNQTFINTKTKKILCDVSGKPKPEIMWHQKFEDGRQEIVENVNSLRQVRHGGELMLMAFSPGKFRPHIHSAIYFCTANNSVGTIRSPDIQLKTVVKKTYDIRVRSMSTLITNTAVLKCDVPEFALNYVRISSWIRQDGLVILSGTIREKYISLPSGELLVNDLDKSDEMESFACEVEDIYTKEKKRSSKSTFLSVVGGDENVAPVSRFFLRYAEVDLGETIVLPCVIHGYPQPTVRWLKIKDDSKDIEYINSDDRRQIFGGALAITQATMHDAGIYQCIAENVVGSEKVEIKLNVIENISVDLGQKLLEVNVGQSVTIPCKYNGSKIESIIWFKDGRVIDSRSLSERHFIIEDEPNVSKLFINPIEPVDDGMYQCIVSNQKSSTTDTVQLVLLRMAPIFEKVFEEQTYQPGPRISLSCSAKGMPRPKIRWFLGGEELMTRGRVSVGEYYDEDTGISVSHVNISSIQVKNSGFYECQASNELGQITHSRKLNVYGRPIFRQMQDKVAIAGQRYLMVHCNFGGYPIDKIWWTKDGMELPINHRQKTFENGSFAMINLRKNIDEGKYMCTVQNNHGHTAHGTMRLTIMRLPTIQPFFFMENMNADDTVQVSCSVMSGDPPFQFKWFKDGRPIAWGLGVNIQSTNKYASVLFIESLQQVHEGTYTCQVSNPAGSRNHSSALHVTVPPRWTIAPHDMTVHQGSNIIVDCQVSGYPPPVIIWKIVDKMGRSTFTNINSNSHIQVYSNGSLSILNVTTDDSGKYLCQATNGIGNGISKVVKIDVRVPPKFAEDYEEKIVLVGSDVMLTCAASGEEPLTILWNITDGNSGSDTSRLRLKNDETENGIVSTMIIFKVKMNDSRMVGCQAENPFGIASKAINLVVQDFPVRPQNIMADSLRSESVKISWKVKAYHYDVTSFVTQCKPSYATASWEDESVRSIKVTSDRNSALVDELDSNTVYQCRVFGQNNVGDGQSSEIITIRTLQLAPHFKPISVTAQSMNSTSIKVSWKVPNIVNKESKKSIKGYIISHKKLESDNLRKLIVQNVLPDNEEYSTVVGSLEEFTIYGVQVIAYNVAGEGPPSELIRVRTDEGVPRLPPRQIRCQASSPSSIDLKWLPPPPEAIHGVITGYNVEYRLQSNIEVHSIRVDKDSNRVLLQKLSQCSNYSLSIAAATRKGDGVLSDAIWCQTSDGIPGPPTEIKSAMSSLTSIMVSWMPPSVRSCNLTKYTVYLSEKHSSGKDLAMFWTSSETNSLNITSLQTANVYQFWVTATSTYGESEASPKAEKAITDRFPPEISEIPKTIIGAEGGVLTLNCSVFGVPPPLRTWKTTYNEENQKTNVETFRNGSLAIYDTRREDSGIYSCTASSDIGKDSIEYVVNIITPPKCAEISLLEATKSTLVVQTSSILTMDEYPTTDLTLKYTRIGENVWKSKHFLRVKEVSKELRSLKCGSTYSLQLICSNEYGLSSSSAIYNFSTNGTAPVSPDHDEFIASNGSHYFLRMESWQNGGCPIQRIDVYYQLITDKEWRYYQTIHDSSNLFLLPSDKESKIDQWKILRIKSYNEAGVTEVDYEMLRAKIQENHKLMKPTEKIDKTLFYTDWKILVPAVAAAVIIIVSLISFKFYQVKRAKSPPPTNKTNHMADMRSNPMRLSDGRSPYLESHGEYLV